MNLALVFVKEQRWAQGHWFVAFNNFWPLVKCIVKRPRKIFSYLDQILYLFSMGRGLLIVVFRIIFAFYTYVLLLVYAIYKDGDRKQYARSIFALMIYCASYLYPQLVGILKWQNQGVWVKTPHKHVARN